MSPPAVLNPLPIVNLSGLHVAAPTLEKDVPMTDASRLTHATIPQLLALRQAELNLSFEDIAEALGYANGTTISMLKMGTMRLPMNKVQEFAKVLELDAGLVMRALLHSIDPLMLQAVEECLAPLALTPGEARLINRLRSAAQGRDIAPVMFEKDAILALVLA